MNNPEGTAGVERVEVPISICLDFPLSKSILFDNKFNFSQVVLPVTVTGNLPVIISAQELFPNYFLPFSWVRKGTATEWLRARHRVWKDCSKPFLGWCKNAEL